MEIVYRVGFCVAGALITHLLWSIHHRRSQRAARRLWEEQYGRVRADAEADELAAKRRRMAGPLYELVNEMLTRVELRGEDKGFCGMTIHEHPEARKLANGLSPYLGLPEREALEEMMEALFSQEARAEYEAATKAGTELSHWLAKV
jgi:hypothetical protein